MTPPPDGDAVNPLMHGDEAGRTVPARTARRAPLVFVTSTRATISGAAANRAMRISNPSFWNVTPQRLMEHVRLAAMRALLGRGIEATRT